MLQRTLPAGFIAPCLPTKTDKLPSGCHAHDVDPDWWRPDWLAQEAQVGTAGIALDHHEDRTLTIAHSNGKEFGKPMVVPCRQPAEADVLHLISDIQPGPYSVMLPR